MDTDDSRHGPPPNTLPLIMGGVMLLFFGLVALVVAEAYGIGLVLGLAGLLVGAYGLAKRDRVRRYGR
ncbi:MAG TPA: hypothetical protein VK063_04975 [Beutenbergiaceae bacterium]|nr:hypothetical protein [Beutenbergiaceae bacterium]